MSARQQIQLLQGCLHEEGMKAYFCILTTSKPVQLNKTASRLDHYSYTIQHCCPHNAVTEGMCKEIRCLSFISYTDKLNVLYIKALIKREQPRKELEKDYKE